MEKVFRIILKALSSILVTIVVILAILLAGVRLIGLTPYTVLSGSMEPTYHVGSVIYVKNVKPDELTVGDPVTFRLSGGTVATHRIIEVINPDSSELSFITQGDANEVSDGVIPAAAIIGKPIFTIPYLGFVSKYIQKPIGLVCVVGCAAAVLILSCIMDSLFSKQKKSKINLENDVG